MKTNFTNSLKNIGNSIHSPEFYSKISKKSFRQSFGYFFLLILILTVIRTITLTNSLLIEAPKAIKNFTQETINCYPKDLEIKISNGQATSSAKQEPYLISCKGNPLLVIDTKTPFSQDKFKEYNSEAWLTRDSIIYKQSNIENKTYSLSKVKDFKLNEDVIRSFQSKYEPYLQVIGPLLLILAFLGIYLAYIFQLIHLLIIAVLVWLVSRGFKQTLSYGSTYKISTFAITLGLIADLVVGLTGRWTHFYGFPFMLTILTLAVVLVNVIMPKNKEKN